MTHTNTLKPYWFRSYISRTRVTTNFQASWKGEDSIMLEKGWASLDAGWIIAPAMFRVHFPKACLFSRMEEENGNAKVWFYNPSVRAFFKNEKDREAFVCWVESSWLYEIPLL